ncbi:MAG TPA: UDP-N-acetylmuramoyl-tripeptide--D-alanyl-D-alanine ligase [Candidatus Saccharicenans sp.]|jgi:UDP-N-acetylmuramoyl-tripeptide--D-alanyl-D-alanine ligase|nr:UDP-N-acetylmuramoyl-tripeptide--D-alanyl-D-alanine ligase [Candidatus Saccharicenans sp.]HNT01567.1 UDP-N-acetylmuramoyl-tripeptide--D-alanyl-D-alanine ligase [Candidatus Saccharicenans sp.]HPB58851.1 UDP-N-acetylmuramoyl-tripeptide--D-alanyl-D-alanine ligase [Candidatus Saccharicenans sp.]HUM78780.1 UDP-N-acetylmuramoyl-tripeptide--D-alanyl-D-alanine ligase [Candidatus Saccharicenans sp.]
MASLSLARLAELTGGKIIQGEPETTIVAYTFDSRQARPGSLFFALKGIRDGHDYIAEAQKKGAVAACVSRKVKDLPPDFGLIQVDDTLHALQQLAARVLAESQLRVVGITGSIGKTSTKELTAGLLSERFAVLKSMGNYNNQIGLPISILSLTDSHQVAVLEMGMNHPGEIKRLVEIAPPEVAVITRIAPVHLEFFQSLEEIALAKKEILTGAKPGATAVLNGDDPLIRQIAADFAPDRIIYFGKSDRYLIGAEDIEYHGWTGLSFSLIYGREKARVELPIFNEGLITNVLAACGVAYYFGLKLAEILPSLHRLPDLTHRGQLIKLKSGATIYDDSYNSNPVALEEVLKSLGRLPAGRKIAVLGDMLELGPAENQFHLEVGALLPAYGWNYLVTVGSRAKLIAEGAVHHGLDSARIESFDRPEEAADWLKSFLEPSDLVLVKGSRGLSLETIVENLKQEMEI